MKYYLGKSIWKWVLVYVSIGIVAYGLIYYFVFYGKGNYNESYQYNSETEINEMKTNTVKYDKPGIYVNDAQGYQINYVTGTELWETLDFNKYCVYLFYKNGYIGIVSLKDDEDALDSGQAITSCAVINGLGEGFIPTTRETVVNNKKFMAEGYKFPTQSNVIYNHDIALAFSFNDNTVIRFGYTNKTNKETSDEEYANTMSIINQMLSTFKFIDETADWKTYRNDEYGFEVKYPSSQMMFLRNPESRDDCLIAMNDYSGNCVLLAIETEKDILAGLIQGIRILLVNHPLDVGVINRNNYSKDNPELACPREVMTKFSIGSVVAYKDENRCSTYYLNESTLISIDNEHFIELEIKQKWGQEQGGISADDWNKIIQSIKFTK